MNLAFGTDKLNLLENQIDLLKQQQSMIKKEQKEVQILADSYASMLKDRGFKIDSNGAVTNATEKILEMEHALEKAEKAQKNYTGSNEKTKQSLQNTYDKANQDLQKAKDILEEYYSTSKQIGDLSSEWYEIEKAIQDASNEVTEFRREVSNLKIDAGFLSVSRDVREVQSEIDILETKIDGLAGADKISAINELITKYKQLTGELQDQLEYEKQVITLLQQRLSLYGFIVRADSTIANYEQQIVNLKETLSEDEFSTVQTLVDEYFDLLLDEIPSIEQEIISTNNAIQNSYQDIADIEQEAADEAERLAEEAERAAEEAEEARKELLELNKLKALDFADELIEQQEKLSSIMDTLEERLDSVYGKNKLSVYEEQVDLIEKQIDLLERTSKEYESQLSYMQNLMSSEYGFTFDGYGNIGNLDSLLGVSDSLDEYNELKDIADEYYEIQKNILESEKDLIAYQNQIRDIADAVRELKYEFEQMMNEAEIKELNNDLDLLINKLDQLQTKQSIGGTDILNNLNQQLGIIEQQKKATEELIEYYKIRKKDLQSELNSYGFEVNDDGTIDDTAEKLEVLKSVLSESEFDILNEKLEEYFDIAIEEMDSLENSLLEYQMEYQEILKQKLEATEKIEQEITKMIEKQVEVTYSLLC